MKTVIKNEAEEEDAAVVHSDVQVKLEPADREREAELLHELYRDHEVKMEITIGPVVLQNPGPSAELVSRDATANSSKRTHLSDCGWCDQDSTGASSTSSCDIKEQGEKIAARFTCDICKGDFKMKSLLARHILHIHMYSNKIKNLLPCKICNEKFSYSGTLNSHHCIHTVDKQFSCKICNKHFSQSSQLIKHQRIIHNGGKLFLCKICSKQFTSKSNLTTHQSVHSDERPYSCKICNKKFSQSSHLIRHQIVHRGDKAYCCKICNKRFSQSSDLSTHQCIHSGVKPYSCKICNKHFSYKSSLILHQRVHTVIVMTRHTPVKFAISSFQINRTYPSSNDPR